MTEQGGYWVLIDWLLAMPLRDDSPHFPPIRIPLRSTYPFPLERSPGAHMASSGAHIGIMALSIHWSCKWARMLTHSSQASAKWLSIWPWGRKMVISRLSRKISRMIKGDRQESLFLMWFYWLAVDQDKRANCRLLRLLATAMKCNCTPNILDSKWSLFTLISHISHMFAHFQSSYVRQKKVWGKQQRSRLTACLKV